MPPLHLVPALAVSLVALTGFAGRAADPIPAKRCATIHGSPVCTWVVSRSGQPVEVRVSVPLALIAGVPADQPMQWPPAELGAVPLPDLAREAFGLDRLGINWEAHGHPPATFLTPHFDFHFYSIDSAGVGAIDCSDRSKPATVPAGFALPDIDIPNMGTLVCLCVPKMGMHALPASDLAATEPFGASPLVGYYGGRPIFVEPMVARTKLLARADFAMTVPPVAHLPAGVRYPRSIRAVYDAGRDEYELILTDFPAR